MSIEEQTVDIMKRIESHKGVTGYVIFNAEGMPIHSTMDNTVTGQYVNAVKRLIKEGRSLVRDLDPPNDLLVMRLRSKKFEMMMAPDNEFTIAVTQTSE